MNEPLILGIGTDQGIQEEEISRLLTRHGADYEVATTPTPHPFTQEETGFYTSYRTDTGKVFAQGLKKGWTPIQNIECMRILAAASKRSKINLRHFFMFGGGRQIVAQIDLGTTDIGNGDKIGNYMSMINGHDGGNSYSLWDTPFRFWCKNQINGSLKDATARKAIVSIKHSISSTEKLEVLMNSIQLSNNEFAKTVELYKQLMNIHVSDALAYDIIDGFFPPKAEDAGPRSKTIRKHKVEDILFRYHSADQGRTARQTAWNLYNAVQGHLQHYRTLTEARQKSVLIGHDSKTAARAMAFILSITASQHIADALTIDQKAGIKL